MTRATQTISIFLLLSSLYLALFLGLIPLPTKLQEDIIPYVPFWALISFGAYLLGKLGYNVMTFHDVPEAHKELMAEIDLARADLKKMGVETPMVLGAEEGVTGKKSMYTYSYSEIRLFHQRCLQSSTCSQARQSLRSGSLDLTDRTIMIVLRMSSNFTLPIHLFLFSQ
ncbi:hypothetical protein D6C78_04545 [Aureobasidium pullulans]|uniref:Dolichol-phosphate mannosyltransferase subunit 3 n=1 Tax=Aureobasidium pullulans TaxID=5580 RepID=A0A4T0BSZ5_AURPU|nr:hypothetical protein D6C78_04545 [Aureobasidium pullulans]